MGRELSIRINETCGILSANEEKWGADSNWVKYGFSIPY